MAKKKVVAKKGNWMAAAFGKNKGALHRQLGVPENEVIPKAKLAAAAKKGGKLGMRARVAQTAAKIARKRKGK